MNLSSLWAGGVRLSREEKSSLDAVQVRFPPHPFREARQGEAQSPTSKELLSLLLLQKGQRLVEE